MNKRQSDQEDDSPDERSHRRRLWCLRLGLFVFAIGVYLPACRYGYLFDEKVILFRQVPPKSFSELIEKSWSQHFPGLEYFRPVPHATYLAQYMWDRNKPSYFHLFNAILMGLTACFVFELLRLPCFRICTIPAAVGAALFAVHPATSSSVTPIVGRETLIAGCLTITAVYAFFRGGRAWYVASIFLLALALLSKEQCVVIPVLFALGDLLGLSRDSPGGNAGRWLLRYVPVGLVVMCYLSIRWMLFSGSEYEFQLFEHPFGPLSSVGYALQTVFLPFVELAYEPALSVWFTPTRLVIASIVLSILCWATLQREPRLRNSTFFWLGWFLVSIAPTANVIAQQAPYSERYVLLAVLAIIAIVASFISSLPSSSSMRRASTCIGLVLVVLSSTITISRGRCFENAMTFSKQWVKTSPTFGEAQMALGIEQHLSGNTDEALQCFQAGLKCGPKSLTYFHSWLGKMRLIQGEFGKAEHHFGWLIDQNPQDHSAYYFSGVANLGLNDIDRAISRFERSLEISPQSGSASFLLAETLELQGKSSEAQQYWTIASDLPAIDLSFSHVDDSHLQRLSGFSNLRFLLLESTLISDAGMEQLRSVTTLNRLWIPGTAVSDRGLNPLRNLPNLNSLVLTNTRITDAGVEDLVSMKSLKHLDVRYTRITQAGLSKLKDGLTDCLIVY